MPVLVWRVGAGRDLHRPSRRAGSRRGAPPCPSRRGRQAETWAVNRAWMTPPRPPTGRVARQPAGVSVCRSRSWPVLRESRSLGWRPADPAPLFEDRDGDGVVVVDRARHRDRPDQGQHVRSNGPRGRGCRLHVGRETTDGQRRGLRRAYGVPDGSPRSRSSRRPARDHPAWSWATPTVGLTPAQKPTPTQDPKVTCIVPLSGQFGTDSTPSRSAIPWATAEECADA